MISLPRARNGNWVTETTIQLWLYDAGTDGGTNYTSPNQDTNPQDPIALHTMLPGYNGVPMGTFTFTRTDLPSVPATAPWAVALLAAALLVVAVFVIAALGSRSGIAGGRQHQRLHETLRAGLLRGAWPFFG